MAKYSENPIPSSDINWNETDPTNGLPWSGKSIREFQQLKNKETENNTATKIGASYFDSDAMTLYQFASESDKDTWLEGGGDSYILNSVPFNFSGTLNQIVLTNRLDGINLYFTTTTTEVILSVGIISQQKGITDLNWQDVNEDFLVNVDLDKGSTGKYTNILSGETVLNGNDFSIDVRKYLATGANRVRISVTGVDTGATKSLVYTLNLTTMYLSPSRFAWYLPFIEGSNYSLGGMNIGGSLSKILKIKVTNTELGYEKLYEKNLGSQTYITSAYYFGELDFPSTGTGVYCVEIWLDASGLESDHLKYNIMCVAMSDTNTAQLVAVNEVPEKVLNYSDSTLFLYSIYNCGSTTGSPSIKASFGADIIVEETLSAVPTNVLQKYSIPLEIETEISDGKVLFEITNGNTETGEVLLDNSASFPAVPDSVFYLNPASRSNVQANREVIINQSDSTEYTATWTDLSWNEGVDGWTEDENGRNCLILPAGCGVNINYQPLSTFPKGSKTIELAFRVSNVADYEEPVITMATEDDSWRGIKIFPKKINVRSILLKDDKSQSYPIKDEELVHVVITVVRDYKKYGNIAQIYVNGGTRCSFSFSGSDDFTTLNNLIFGSSSSDLYIYKMRVYDNGFEWPGVVQNFINCLPGSEERVAVFEKMNKILDDSYNISYDAIKDTHNTMVIEMLDGEVLPDLLHPGGGQCNLVIDIKDPIPEELDSDFTNLLGGQEILNQTIEGQGTTAMTYFRWNFRWKLDKTYNKRRITAKKNVASSMHSHKMGATRAYNDLHNEIVGLNEAGGRVAVYQYPVFGFIRTLNELGEYNYDFIGLYTVGPDKGDKTAFGFDSEQYKNTVIHMEGTDHTPMSVGMDYPWSELRYSAAKEGFGAVAKSGDIATAWEVGMAGDLSPDEASDEVEVMAMINSEFKPAYEVAYNNSPFILGVTETLEEINSQKTEWRKRTLESGKSYSELEFFTDGVYDLYYWNIQNETYQSNGINLLTDLSISETEISDMTLEEKTQFFIEKRKERFTAQWGNYWNIQDVIYCYTFLMIFAATDNFKKNSYPYKFAALADGGKWCWRQDDLDTLGDINNQGFSSKVFSVLVGDTTSSGSVFRGDNSVFWSLVGMTQKEEIKKMVHSIFDAMKDKSPYGQSTLEKVSGYIRSVMWDYAQDYFGESAYNVDAGWTYEEAWKLRIDGKYNNDVDPLGQSLGSHYEAERDWFELRVLFIAAYYNYGPFSTDNGDDTSTGQISFRASSGKTYTITPAIDFNPTILIGQSDLTTAGDRIMAGESVSIVVPDMGNNDTHVYIQGADWYTDLGDLKDIAVSTDNPVFTVSSKRLQNLKLGDEIAENVTSNIGTLNIGACPSLENIDARNVSTLTGTVDLSKCPRLKKALFGGSSTGEIALPRGSKITEFELPDSITNLSLVNLPNLSYSSVESGVLSDYEINKYYLTNQGVGNVCTLEPTPSGSWACKKFDCSNIISMTITGVGGNGPRLWCFLDAENKIISVADQGAQATNLIVPVPDGAKTAIVNFGNTGNTVYSVVVTARVSGLKIGDLTALSYLRVENSPNIQGFALLKATFKDGAPLTNIRVIGFDYNGDLSDVQLLAQLASGGYFGINEDGSRNPNIIPVIEGTLNVVGSIYEDDEEVIEEKYGAGLILNVTGGYYIRFNDPAWQELVAAAYGDGVGITQEQADAVTRISESKFASDTTVTEITDLYKFRNLKTIQGNAFGKSVTTLYIPDSVTVSGLLSNSPINKLIIGKGITSFTSGRGLNKLTEVVIPDTVTSLGNQAFDFCSSLKRIVLGRGLTSTGAFSFRGVAAIDALYIPSVADYLKISFNDSNGHPNLANATIYIGTINEITEDKGIYGNIVVDYDWDKLEQERVLVSTEMVNEALKEITEIKTNAFRRMKQLEGEIVIPSNIKTIRAGAFTFCTGLTSLVIEEGVETIGNNIAEGCSGLSGDLVIPDSVTMMGEWVFNQIYKTTGTDRLFINLATKPSLTTDTHPNGRSPIYNTGFKEIHIDNVQALVKSRIVWFVNAVNVSKYRWDLYVNDILTKDIVLDCPETHTIMTAILAGSSITSIKLNEGFTETVGFTFDQCIGLSFIDLPSTISNISSSALRDVMNNPTVICRALTPPTLGGQVAFIPTSIYVPDESVEAYKAATNWSTYAEKIKPLSEYVES